MSSQGTFIARKNSIVNNNKEVYVCSTEKFYSSINLGSNSYTSQSEILNLKQARRNKFAGNKRACRQEKLKNMRKNGNQNNVPKKAPKKSPSSKPQIDFVHQSLVEKLYPASYRLS